MSLNPNEQLPPQDRIGTRPSLDAAQLGLPPEASPSVRIDAFNCSIGPKNDGQLYDRGYGYNVRLMFDTKESRERFMARPTLQEDANTIRNTTESMLQESFDLEAERDSDAFYASENPDERTMINTLTSGTQNDIDATQPELGAILKQTFPDSGITGVHIEDIKPIDAMCYPSNGLPYADNGPAADQSLTLGQMLPRLQTPGL